MSLVNKSPRSPKEKYTTLYFGNLGPECSTEILESYVGHWVKVLNIEIERYEANCRSIGYAFVETACHEGAELCILNLSGTMLFGKRIFVGWAKDARKILFGNLEGCAKAEFAKTIHALADVQDLGMGTAGGGNVHFAVVTFNSHDDALRVMKYFKSDATKRLEVCARWLYFFQCPWNSSFVRTRHPIEF